MTTDRLRILVLNHAAVPRDQPGGTRHIELFSRLQDCDFTIVASRLNLTTGKPQKSSPGFTFVPVTPYRTNGIFRILNWCSFAIAAVVAGLRFSRPDVVYASSPHLLAGLSGWLLARVRRARFVLEIRDLWPQTLIDMGHLDELSVVIRVLRALELFLYRRADFIVAMAPGTVEAITAHGIDEDRIVYLPNGADPEDFAASEDRDTLRARYGFTRLTGVYAGAHGPANGLDLLIAAADVLRELDLDIVMIGDGVAKVELEADAHRRGLRHVRFLDPVPKTEIVDVLAAADFGVHVLAEVDLFQSSVSPNKVFDYMAAGLPVISNCPGPSTTFVTDAGCGWVVPAGHLSQAIRELSLASPTTLRAYGNRGQEWIRVHQSRTAIAQQLRAILADRRRSRT